MPVAKIINGRYSIVIEHDRNDPTFAKKPPLNPCCKLERNVGARYWAIGNLIFGTIYLILKIIDLLIWSRNMNIFGWKGYNVYLESLYCTESPPASLTSLSLDCVGQLVTTSGNLIFLIAVFSKKEPRYRLRLSRWSLFSLCGGLCIFIVSKLTVIIADMEYSEYIICSPQVYHKLAIILWSVLITLWLHLAAWNIVSFMYWLEMKITEARQQQELNQAQLQSLPSISKAFPPESTNPLTFAKARDDFQSAIFKDVGAVLM